MKITHLISLLLLIVIFGSCRKIDKSDLNSSSNPLKEKVLSYLNNKQKRVSDTYKKKIETIKGRITWSEHYETLRRGAKRIFFTLQNETSHSARIEDNVYSILCVEENTSGAIVQISTVDVVEPNNTSNINQFIADLIDNNTTAYAGYSGSLSKKYISGRLIYGVDFSNGQVSAFKKLKRGNTGSRGMQTEDCVDWYLQTFYDGVLVSEIFLYSECAEPYGGGGEEGGGGGGENNEPVANEDPCDKATRLDSNWNLRSRLFELDSVMNVQNQENMYVQGLDNGVAAWQFISGIPDVHELPGFNPNPGVQLFSVMHSHFGTNSYSTFSASDLKFLYNLYKDSHAAPGFSFVITTPQGTYAIALEDSAAFMAFGDTHLDDQLAFLMFDGSTYSSYGMYEGMSALEGEIGLTKLFEGMNTGLKLLKNHPQAGFFDYWLPLEYVPATNYVTIKLCPS